MKAFIFLISSMMFVVGCSHSVEPESRTHDVVFSANGVDNAQCIVAVNEARYEIFPPQTLTLKQSEHDINVRCEAAGKNDVELTIPAQFEKQPAIWGVSNRDLVNERSGPSYVYPSVINIEFSDNVVTPAPLEAVTVEDLSEPLSFERQDDLFSSEPTPLFPE